MPLLEEHRQPQYWFVRHLTMSHSSWRASRRSYYTANAFSNSSSSLKLARCDWIVALSLLQMCQLLFALRRLDQERCLRVKQKSARCKPFVKVASTADATADSASTAVSVPSPRYTFMTTRKALATFFFIHCCKAEIDFAAVAVSSNLTGPAKERE